MAIGVIVCVDIISYHLMVEGKKVVMFLQTSFKSLTSTIVT